VINFLHISLKFYQQSHKLEKLITGAAQLSYGLVVRSFKQLEPQRYQLPVRRFILEANFSADT